MIKQLLAAFAFSLLIMNPIYSQENHEFCGSDFILQNLLKNEEYKEKVIKIESDIQKRIVQKKLQKTQELVHTIPVVVHVVHLGEAVGVGSNISDAQIESGIQQLTDAFRNKSGMGIDVNIEFALAKLDPNCNPTNGINRVDGSGVASYSSDGVSLGGSGADETAIKALSIWSNEMYYNIWLVTEINGNDGGNGTQGFAYYPGAGPTIDGAMILHSSWGDQGTAKSWNNQGETGVHEIGHALNLYHTFEGDNDGNSCPSDGCGKDNGDCCDDTPPHIRSASDCVIGTNTCDGGSSTELFIHNYMDYANQSCGYLFTADQKSRMRAALETQRGGLLTSKALNGSISYSKPIASSCSPVTSPTGLASLVGGILNVKIADLDYSSGYAKTDGGYLDLTDDCLSAITTTVASTPTLEVTVGVNSNKVKAWIDFNNDGTFDESTEKVMDLSVASKGTGSATVKFPATVVTDQYLRLRVMNEVNTSVTGPCYDPTYGQAEDYAIVVMSAVNAKKRELSAVKVQPNPFTNSILIQDLPNAELVAYQLYDITGKLVLEGATGNNMVQLNTSEFKKGTYLMRINTSGETFSKKLIKL